MLKRRLDIGAKLHLAISQEPVERSELAELENAVCRGVHRAVGSAKNPSSVEVERLWYYVMNQSPVWPIDTPLSVKETEWRQLVGEPYKFNDRNLEAICAIVITDLDNMILSFGEIVKGRQDFMKLITSRLGEMDKFPDTVIHQILFYFAEGDPFKLLELGALSKDTEYILRRRPDYIKARGCMIAANLTSKLTTRHPLYAIPRGMFDMRVLYTLQMGFAKGYCIMSRSLYYFVKSSTTLNELLYKMDLMATDDDLKHYKSLRLEKDFGVRYWQIDLQKAIEIMKVIHHHAHEIRQVLLASGVDISSHDFGPVYGDGCVETVKINLGKNMPRVMYHLKSYDLYLDRDIVGKHGCYNSEEYLIPLDYDYQSKDILEFNGRMSEVLTPTIFTTNYTLLYDKGIYLQRVTRVSGKALRIVAQRTSTIWARSYKVKLPKLSKNVYVTKRTYIQDDQSKEGIPLYGLSYDYVYLLKWESHDYYHDEVMAIVKAQEDVPSWSVCVTSLMSKIIDCVSNNIPVYITANLHIRATIAIYNGYIYLSERPDTLAVSTICPEATEIIENEIPIAMRELIARTMSGEEEPIVSHYLFRLLKVIKPIAIVNTRHSKYNWTTYDLIMLLRILFKYDPVIFFDGLPFKMDGSWAKTEEVVNRRGEKVTQSMMKFYFTTERNEFKIMTLPADCFSVFTTLDENKLVTHTYTNFNMLNNGYVNIKYPEAIFRSIYFMPLPALTNMRIKRTSSAMDGASRFIHECILENTVEYVIQNEATEQETRDAKELLDIWDRNHVPESFDIEAPEKYREQAFLSFNELAQKVGYDSLVQFVKLWLSDGVNSIQNKRKM